MTDPIVKQMVRDHSIVNGISMAIMTIHLFRSLIVGTPLEIEERRVRSAKTMDFVIPRAKLSRRKKKHTKNIWYCIKTIEKIDE